MSKVPSSELYLFMSYWVDKKRTMGLTVLVATQFFIWWYIDFAFRALSRVAR